MKRSEALKLRSVMEQSAVSLDDQTASKAPAIFPRLKGDGAWIPVGTRIHWNGIIKKASVDLWDNIENNPENAPGLWEDLEYREGYRIIPNTLTITTAFAKDEWGWWEDELYRSLTEVNVYTPVEYPLHWEKM